MTSNQGIVFIVNGEPIEVPISDDAVSFSWLRRLALRKSWNIGRPATDWELRDERGTLLDPETTVADFAPWFAGPRWPRMFLTIQIGAGGHHVLQNPTAVYAPTTNILPYDHFVWWP